MNKFLRGSRRWLGALAVIAGLSACSQPPKQAPVTTTAPATAQPTTPAPQPTTPPATTVPTAAPAAMLAAKTPTPATVGPLTASFAGLGEQVSKTLGVPVTAGEGTYKDPFAGQDIPSYQVVAKGTCANWSSVPVLNDKIEKLLIARGWTQEVKYGATGMTTLQMGYRRGKQLGVLTIAWKASDDANWPKDKPFPACNGQPEQTLFTITLNCMLEE